MISANIFSKKILLVFCIILNLVFSLNAFAYKPENTDSCQSNTARSSLWVGEKKKVIELSAENGEHLLEMPVRHLEDIAVDNYRGAVWVGTRKEVIKYTLEGREIFRYPLSDTSNAGHKNDNDCDKGEKGDGDDDCDEEGERVVHISLNPSDGSLWIGAKDEVIKLSSDGNELFKIRDLDHVEDVSADISDGSCWAGLKNQAIKYNSDGTLLFTYNIENGNKIQAISADPYSHSLWIGTKKSLIKINTNGIEEFRTDTPHDIQDLKIDLTDASIWLVTKKEIFRYDSPGEQVLYFIPCTEDNDKADSYDSEDKHNKGSSETSLSSNGSSGDEERCEGNLITLAADPADGTAWVAWKKSLLKLTRTGGTLLRLAGFKQIQALDIGLPILGIDITAPPDGAAVDTSSITVSGTVTDITAEVEVNGFEALVIGNCFEAQGIQLVPGHNTITATATNIAGRTASDTIHVTYQPSLPPLTVHIDSPEEAATFFTQTITVGGTVSDPDASVSVNGVQASVSGNTFEASGINLQEGQNIITANATDNYGQTASHSITVTLITKGTITGTVTDSITGLALSGVAVTVTDSLGPHSTATDANGIYLISGVNQGSFTVTFNKSGYIPQTISGTLVAGQTLTLNIQLTPIPPLAIAITSPVNGSVFSTFLIDVTGTVSDPDAEVTVNGIEASVSGNSFTARNIPIVPGENQIIAEAKDSIGRSASDSIIVIYKWLDVAITYPLNGDILSFSPIVVEGTVSDPSAYVEVNGKEAVVSGDGMFIAYGLKLANGLNEITAQATNRMGQTDEDSVQVSYGPPSLPLSISILSPYDGARIESDNLTIAGLVNDPEATVIVNDTVAKVDEDGFYSASIYACDEPIGEGDPQPRWNCTVTVIAYSKDGQEISTDSITYTYIPSQDPLTIKITDPAQNQIVAYSYYEVQGELHDVLSSVAITRIQVNGVTPGVYSMGENSFSAYVDLLDGLNYITVHAINAVGHDAFDTIKIIHDPSDKPLRISIFSPLDQAIVNYSPVNVSGRVSHSAAEVDVNGIWADVDMERRSFKAMSVPLSPGVNLITANVWIPTEETSFASITVTYDPDYPSPPPPVLSSLPEYSTSPVLEVSGLSLPDLTVEVFVNNQSQTSVRADLQGLFKTSVTLPNEGSNHISVRAIDQYGNTSNLSNEAVVIRDTIMPHIGTFYYPIINALVSRFHIRIITEPLANLELSINNNPDYSFSGTTNERGEFHLDINISTGIHPVTITSTDKAGNVSQHNGFLYVNEPGEISCRLHGGGISHILPDDPIQPKIDPLPNPVNEPVITIEGNAYAGFEVEIYRNNELIAAIPVDNNGRFKLEGVNLIPGTNILKVKQKAGIMGYRGVSYVVKATESPEVVVDLISGIPQRPNVQIDFPVNGAITDAEFIPMRGTVTPDVDLRLNGYYDYYGYAINSGNLFVSNHKIPLIPGANTLWVEAIAPDGSRGVDKITVYSKKDAVVPEVMITSPAPGEEVYDWYITASGSAADSVQKVIVNEAEATLNNGSFDTAINIFSGYVYNPYRYDRMATAWAMDANGNIGHHDVPFKYRYITPPYLSITSPLGGEILTSSPTVVTGVVYDASEVTVNGVPAVIDGNTYTVEIDLNEGQNRITVIAKNTVKASVEAIYVTYTPGSTITLQSITIEPSSAVIPLGDASRLRAIGTYSSGEQVDLSRDCFWESSDYNVADVAFGLVSGLREGTATITAMYNGLTGTSAVNVSFPVLKSVMVVYEKGMIYAADNPTITMGDTLQLRAFGVYSDGNVVDISQRATWALSDPSVAVIDASGLAAALSKGTTLITATDRNTLLAGTTTLTVIPPPMYIFITSPASDSTVNKSEVTVTGTVITQADEAGITVNGITASVIGNQFVANKVPLYEGGNVITAKAVDSNGVAAEARITVMAALPANYIRLTSNIESGISPLEVTLRIDGTFSIDESTISVTGPGSVEFLYSSADEYQIKLTAEGIYYFTAEATGPDGNIYQDTIAITVLNKTQLDALLKAKWEGMKEALVTGNIDGALIYFLDPSKERFNQAFTALGYANVNSIFTPIAELRLNTIYGPIAQYWAIRTETEGTFAYPVTFVQDLQGLWKIMGF